MSDMKDTVLLALDSLSSDDLKEIAEGAAAAAKVKEASRWTDAKHDIDCLADKLGLAPTELFGRLYPASKPVPKYSDPASGKTWTGRGKLPQWLRDNIADGVSLDHFLIVKPETVG